ncbi:MAG: LapA family protein [Gammaproteobacteria bacterium]|nr:LapA family protein [Gammaproteobacteria bacterium]
MKHFKILFSVVLLSAVAVFVLQNTAVVELTLLIWTVSSPRALVVFSVLLVGVVLGWLWRGQCRRS